MKIIHEQFFKIDHIREAAELIRKNGDLAVLYRWFFVFCVVCCVVSVDLGF
jgi:hypothetical protein